MDKTWTTAGAALLLVALAAAGVGAQPNDAYTAALRGNWVGTLQYRDYRSDARVTLPTTLVVAESATGAELAYTYDDGPGKTVRSIERITISPDRGSYRVQNGDGTYDATFAAEGLREFGGTSNTVVLTGKGVENDQPVELRITIVVGRDTWSMLRESRPAAGEWRFRNEYRFKRSGPPAP